MRAALAFFDVDHTITRGSTGRRFAETAALRGIIKLRQLALIPLSYVCYRLGGGGTALFERDFPGLEGVERSRLEELGREVFSRRTSRALRASILARIEEIEESGCPIVLATSSLDFIVRPLAELLGAEAVLASELEFEGGRCTGRMAGKPLFGEAKLEAAAAFARARGLSLSDCASYSDSIHDLPMLLASGQPVAVAPDRRLRREAEARGWEIVPD